MQTVSAQINRHRPPILRPSMFLGRWAMRHFLVILLGDAAMAALDRCKAGMCSYGNDTCTWTFKGCPMEVP